MKILNNLDNFVGVTSLDIILLFHFFGYFYCLKNIFVWGIMVIFEPYTSASALI